jgi:hypothetical protein
MKDAPFHSNIDTLLIFYEFQTKLESSTSLLFVDVVPEPEEEPLNISLYLNCAPLETTSKSLE